MNCCAALLAFSIFGSSAQEPPAAECVEAMRRALDGGRAEWTMERRIAGRAAPLVSSGTVECVAGSGIVWRVSAPFEASIAMTRDSMKFEDEDGTRIKPISELPHYSELRRRTDAFAAGDATAFDGLLELKSEKFPDGGWRLEMVPEVSAMKRLFTKIELSGAHLPTNAVLSAGDGGRSVIRFRRRADAQ